MTVVEALAREVGSVGKALHRLPTASWELPTRCPPLRVKELVGHMLGGAYRIVDGLAADPIDDEPEHDAATYFGYDAAAEAPVIVTRAQERAQGKESAALVSEWDVAWGRALREARASIDADPVIPTPFGLIRLSEYLKTRAVEVVVHHMDVDEALGHDLHPDEEALAVAGDVLRTMLGTDLRPVGMDDVRFLLTGTGRAPLNDEERAYLGPLADAFPLLA